MKVGCGVIRTATQTPDNLLQTKTGPQITLAGNVCLGLPTQSAGDK
jgi:hypothetical protein